MIWGGGLPLPCQMVKMAPAAPGEVLNALVRTGAGATTTMMTTTTLLACSLGQLREGTSWVILVAPAPPSVLWPYTHLLLPTWSILGEEWSLGLFSTDFGGSGESGSHGGPRPCVWMMRTEASEVQQRAG